MALLGHFNPNGPRAISIQMAQQGHFNPVQVDSALNHPLKCLVIGPVIGKEVSKLKKNSKKFQLKLPCWAISIQMAQQGHFNPVQVDSALNHPLKCLVIGPVIGKEVSKTQNCPQYSIDDIWVLSAIKLYSLKKGKYFA